MNSLHIGEVLTWSPWHALHGCWRGAVIPALPGLYRIRRIGCTDLDYLGQTGAGGMTLRSGRFATAPTVTSKSPSLPSQATRRGVKGWKHWPSASTASSMAVRRLSTLV